MSPLEEKTFFPFFKISQCAIVGNTFSAENEILGNPTIFLKLH